MRCTEAIEQGNRLLKTGVEVGMDARFWRHEYMR